MFQVKLQEETYGFRFSYRNEDTLVELVEIPEEKNIIHTGFYGIASTHYTDQFVKRIGRKVALTHLLKALSSQDIDGPILLNKEDRTKIWEEYFKTHKR